jgi:hypothetical protein
VVVVVYGGNAPDGLAVALGDKEVHPRVVVEGVLSRVELLSLGKEEGRDPVRIIPVPRERVADKALYVGARPASLDPVNARTDQKDFP